MIHKEGFPTLTITLILFAIVSFAAWSYLPGLFPWLVLVLSGLWLFLVSFFRNPNRKITETNDNIILAPADGKVVVIESTKEAFLNEEVMQISIFMSPLNVHVNRNPINGEVLHSEHHQGKFLPAWDPKASTENERTTVLYQHPKGKILMRQIAGALAKRIVNYLKKGDQVTQGDDMGFIKLGSRVDLFIPKSAQIKVKMDQKVQGNRTVIAEW